MTELISRYTDAQRCLIDKAFLRLSKMRETTVDQLSVDYLLFTIHRVNRFLIDHPSYNKVVEMEYQRYSDNQNLFEDILNLFFVDSEN